MRNKTLDLINSRKINMEYPKSFFDYLQRIDNGKRQDLTSYMAMIGKNFENKIDLLTQLIHDKHHPSLGLYKEKILQKTISDFLPKRYEVGTGFVLFPNQIVNLEALTYGLTNTTNLYHDISTQLDLIIYDAHDFPVIFKEGDFVVVRPESVHSIIEVTGSLDNKKIEKTCKAFIDYSRKWKQCRIYYNDWGLPEIPVPLYLLMAWKLKSNVNGKAISTPIGIIKKIIKTYNNNLENKEELKGFPLLENICIYNNSIIQSIYYNEVDENSFGYFTSNGKYIEHNDDETKKEIGDRTINHLLYCVQSSLSSPLNYSLSYIDQTTDDGLTLEDYKIWLKDKELDLLHEKYYKFA